MLIIEAFVSMIDNTTSFPTIIPLAVIPRDVSLARCALQARQRVFSAVSSQAGAKNAYGGLEIRSNNDQPI